MPRVDADDLGKLEEIRDAAGLFERLVQLVRAAQHVEIVETEEEIG
jgi:hypothetical protein